jgi:hypothetical protein
MRQRFFHINVCQAINQKLMDALALRRFLHDKIKKPRVFANVL